MNHLANSSSPYLLQHSNNPVDWYPWGEAAFDRAREEQKPIFLSIGYSTCHWCHVMAHESFENEAIAALLNEHFICVKVDREERPDVDRLYMTYVQALTGSGGWPMSVWLTPELKPFFGGTYFPPENREGRIGFPSVLRQLAQLWHENRSTLEREAVRAVNALQQLVKGGRGDEVGGIETKEILDHAYHQWAGSFDSTWGGFGVAPKFPRPSVLFFLLRYATLNTDSKMHLNAEAKQAQEMVLLTLRKMAAGGLQDHLGGGFHRYSVDRIWQVPHFEKMLYDQAQLVMAYLEASQNLPSNSTNAANSCVAPVLASSSTSCTLWCCAPSAPGSSSASASFKTGSLLGKTDSVLREEFLQVVRDTLDYVLRDMTASEGGFYSAEDADSLDTSGKKCEGAFYVWSEQEIKALLTPEETALVTAFYYIQTEGNISEESDPHGELVGKNILMALEDAAEVAQRLQLDEKTFAQRLASAKEKLFVAREQRPRPHRDDKIITAWNGLMISAFARVASQQLKLEVEDEVKKDYGKYLDAAIDAATFLREHLYDATSGELRRSWCDGQSTEQGFAEDYAFLIQGLLDLHEATLNTDSNIQWLQWADVLQKKMEELFWDDEHGGYFSSAEGDPHLLMRTKEEYDGAEPSANSIAALNLLRFSRMFHDDVLAQRAERIIKAAASTLEGMATAVPQLLVALCAQVAGYRLQVAV